MSNHIFNENPKTVTVSQARDWLRHRAKDGVRCPCCRQYVKVYKRPLGSSMARWLIWLVRTWDQKYGDRSLLDAPNDAWVDIRLAPVRGGDYAKLLHWDLVQHCIDVLDRKKDTRDSGLWRPTFKGIDFVQNKLEVPSHVFLYANIKIGEESKLITIRSALGKKWSYDELMNEPINADIPRL